MPRAASSRPELGGGRRYSGLEPELEPANTHTRIIASSDGVLAVPA